jgi:hypothetical protein
VFTKQQLEDVMQRTPVSPPGARIRSRLNWLILKTLAVDVGVPLVAAELIELIRACTSRSYLQAEYRMRHPSYPATYLRRLAERGCVKLEGLKRHRQATLTPAGRRALEALEALYGNGGNGVERGEVSPLHEQLDRIRHERMRRLSRRELTRRMERQRREFLRRIPGPPRATVFVSYDLPRGESGRRRLVIAVLKGHGFRRVHQSLYVGPSERLRAALETLEPFDVLSRCCWGTLTVFKP